MQLAACERKMLCVLCRWLIDKVSTGEPIKIDRLVDFGLDKSWKMMDAWWHHGVNDEVLIASDRDIESVHCAHDAWDVDHASGFQAFLKLAQEGSVWSMIQVARAYCEGWGTTADHAEAEAWYRKAYAGGSDEAMLYLGWIAHLRRDSIEAESFLAAGVAKGLSPAMRRLARVKLGLVRTQPARNRARQLLEDAAALGDLGARCDLIVGQAKGMFGVRYVSRGLRGTIPLARDIITWIDAELDRRGAAVPG